jgi:hypothetical protein
LGAIFLAVGLAGAGVGAHWASTLREFVKRATVTSGTVVELQRVRSQSAHEADVYQPVVRFELPSGKAIVFRDPVGSSPPPYGVGERVEVRYDPLRPGDARVGSLRNLWAWPVLVGGLSAMFALAGLSLLLWYRQEAREVRRLVRGDAPAGRGLDSVDRSGSRPRG